MNVINVQVDKAAIENRKSTPNITDVGGIAGALARALEERRRNMHNSDGENSLCIFQFSAHC